jgi:uncharacterized protein (TIGR00251 family)
VIALRGHPEGVILPIRAQPGARKTALIGEHGGALKLAVTAPPDDGRANAALIELVRELLGLKRSQVELIGGATSRNKSILIRGMPADRVADILQKLRAP